LKRSTAESAAQSSERSFLYGPSGLKTRFDERRRHQPRNRAILVGKRRRVFSFLLFYLIPQKAISSTRLQRLGLGRKSLPGPLRIGGGVS